MIKLNRNIMRHFFRSGAFTLMEVLIALSIASIALLALLKLHLVSTALADKAELTSQAALLAEGKISETLAEGYPDLGLTGDIVQHGDTNFQWRTKVTDISPGQFDNLNIQGIRKISVEVEWKAGLANRHLSMSTYVADRQLNETEDK
jgi:prepilin-type N-terminal cleavage/methylation domain-containing protein